MNNELCKRICNLLCVKSIVTIALTVTFCIMTSSGNVPQELNTAYLMVMSFYFGTQATKKV